LLYLFNFCHETQRYCLFTSSIFPTNFYLADLSSRIKSIDRICISSPDKEAIKIILSKQFSKKSLLIEPKIIDLIAEIIPLNFDSAVKAVEILNQTSLSTGKNINLAMIKKIFF
jgi:chromosomal replication initiation ATPase DnaA